MFITIVIEGIPYLVFRLWLGDDPSLSRLAQAVSASEPTNKCVLSINQRRTLILGELREQYPSSSKKASGDSNRLLSLMQLLDYAHGLPTPVSVTLPSTMFGEFMPSLVALVSGGSIKIHTPRGANSASLRPTLAIFGGNISTDAPGPHGPFSEVHFRFAHQHWPSRIRFLIEKQAGVTDAYCAQLILHAKNPGGSSKKEEKKAPHRGKPSTTATPKVASFSSSSSVSSTNVLSFCIWIRMALTNESKNMKPELLGIIIEEIARVAMLAHDGITGCELILLGDREPIGEQYRSGADIGTKLQRHLSPSLTHTVLDLRGYFDTRTTVFEDFYRSYPPVATEACPGSGAYLSYYLQWSVLNWLARLHKPVFVVGSESGNMDAMGHMGVQVISIDLTDKVAETEHCILTDRIGQYALMTPLWQIVNYENGKNEAGFRGYLRGAMLRYLLAAKPELLDVVARKAGSGSAPVTSIPVPVEEPVKRILLIEEGKAGSVRDEINARTLTIVHACDDGNCLFDAIAQQIGETASMLRGRAAVNEAMRVEGTYVDTQDLAAIGTTLGVSIVLYEAHYGQTTAVVRAPMGAGDITVYLLLRSIRDEHQGHYDLLRMPG